MSFVARLKARLATVAMIGVLVAPATAAEPGLTDTEITIGMFATMSGPLASFGFDPLQAAKMWYEEVNKNGGIHGRKIKMLVEDDKCNPNEAVAGGDEHSAEGRAYEHPRSDYRHMPP